MKRINGKNPPAKKGLKKRKLRPPDQKRTYAIGRGKTPKEHQFKPGVSGNPSGKRKGKKSLATILNDVFFRPVEVRENGKHRKMPLLEALLRTYSDKALKDQNVGLAKFLLGQLHMMAADESARAAKNGREAIPTITKDMDPNEAAALYLATIKDLEE